MMTPMDMSGSLQGGAGSAGGQGGAGSAGGQGGSGSAGGQGGAGSASGQGGAEDPFCRARDHHGGADGAGDQHSWGDKT